MIRVLNTELYDRGLKNLINEILSSSVHNEQNNYLVSPSDANVLVTARRNREFGELLNSFYMNIPDGMPSVWIGRLKGAKEMDRCYGPDLFKELIIATRNDKSRHFLCGGNDGVAEKLKIECENKFGNKNICGIYSPPFRDLEEEDYKEIANIINNARTDFLWVGLSSPKQHYFAKRISKYTNVKFIFTVGAAFDFHTGNVKQAPYWIQRSGLEWLYRVLREPGRLFKRYAVTVPLFIYYNIIDFLLKKGNK